MRTIEVNIVHVPNVREESAVTCLGTTGGGSIGVGLYTRAVKWRVLYAWTELPRETMEI